MSEEGGTKATIAALAANLAIAATKFIAWLLTGASSMLSEAIHSLADTGNQVLLLAGGRRGARGATAAHPFGYGRQRYINAFLVSIILFSAGGLFALYEAVHKASEVLAGHGDELMGSRWWWVPVAVLLVSAVAESLSLRTALHETRAQRRGRGLLGFVRATKSPELPAVLLEDTAALAGLVLALVGIVLTLRHEVAVDTGHLCPEVDLGGGYGIAYTGADPVPPSPAQVARTLAEAVRETCERLGDEVPTVSIEPGRAVAGPTTVTLYTVTGLKRVELEEGASRLYVSIDGGMSDNIRPALYEAAYTALVANRRPDPQAGLVRSRVVGKHCESGDVVVRDVDLPADLAVGDVLAVPATGAYGRSMASNYNLFTRPGVRWVREGESGWILRPETIEDLIRLEG